MTRIRTALALGVGNIFHVLSYRLRLALGIHPVQTLKAATPAPPFFAVPAACRHGLEPATRPMDSIPDWRVTPVMKDTPWWKIQDFTGVDIKTIWQASRFEWAVTWAQHAALGDTSAIDHLNAWISDWLHHNPPYMGVNWKCGQEAALRVIHLALAAHLLQQRESPSAGLRQLISMHLQRIAATRRYAIAQDNNHGITEAAALFIGESWLSQATHTGRAQLEERVDALVMADGTFSLYSVNYHRMVLDTLVIVEVWRSSQQLPAFSERFYHRARLLTHWLHAMVDPTTGDAPNLGANDGTCLLKIGPTEDRDYRPSLQRAAALFLDRNAAGDQASHPSLAWLGIVQPAEHLPEPASQSFPDGGLTVARRHEAMALLRYPQFRFRPSQADLLHVDFWHRGQNILRDGGSYSYADSQAHNYFSGIEGHNTIQFDDHEPMPRLGRFLFGDWIRPDHVTTLTETASGLSFDAGYTDTHGARHVRHVHLKDTALQIEDTISNFQQRAVLRWRLLPGEWKMEGSRLIGHGYCLTVSATTSIARMALLTGWESRYYLQRNELPVLEIELHEPSTITTQLQWTA